MLGGREPEAKANCHEVTVFDFVRNIAIAYIFENLDAAE